MGSSAKGRCPDAEVLKGGSGAIIQWNPVVVAPTKGGTVTFPIQFQRYSCSSKVLSKGSLCLQSFCWELLEVRLSWPNPTDFAG